MTVVVRWFVIVVLAVHGLLQLLLAAKGLGWAELSQLALPIGVPAGMAWLGAALLSWLSAAAIAVRARWWWVVAALAAVASQAVLVTAWDEAKAGTLANLVVLSVAGYGFVSGGPGSMAAEWNARARRAITRSAGSRDLLTEQDLSALPSLVAGYVRRSGAVGKPRVANFSADIRGRIRGGPNQPWMSFTGKQLNTYGSAPQRLFLINASRSGLPIVVLHVFDTSKATMRAKALSLISVVAASGPDMTQAETVTLFNDMVLLAPAALVDAPITWTPIDDLRVRGSFTNGTNTVTADLVFNQDHELVDFVSDDRLRASSDGTTFTRQRWSTPVRAYRQLDDRRVAVDGEAHWHAQAPEGEFSYLDFHVDALAYNVSRVPTHRGATREMVSRPRRARVLQAIALFLTGCLALATGLGIGLPHLAKTGIQVLAVAGLLSFAAGLVLVGSGSLALLRETPRWYRVVVVPALLASLVVALTSLGQAVAATTVPRTSVGSVSPADFGLGYGEVRFRTADGVMLSAWYVPSSNRAALVLLHGAGSTRSSVVEHAAVLARHGYGVLLPDARGHGRSAGRAMDFGWYGDLDIAAAVSYLQTRSDVDHGRIAAVGLSMGGEEAIGAMATDARIRAVVAEGATNRVTGDRAWLPNVHGWRGTIQQGIDWLTYQTADLLTAADQPIVLRDAVTSAAPRPVFLIAAGAVADEGDAARYIQSGSAGTVDLWVVPGAGHTAALTTQPDQWEHRVTEFLDAALQVKATNTTP